LRKSVKAALAWSISEREEQWSAARLHLDQLVNENPKDDALCVRRARARDRAAMEELK
jgi:hypothetical protein